MKEVNSGIIQKRLRIVVLPKEYCFLIILMTSMISVEIKIAMANTVTTGTLHIRQRKSYKASILVVFAIQVPLIPESKKRENSTGNMGIYKTMSAEI